MDFDSVHSHKISNSSSSGSQLDVDVMASTALGNEDASRSCNEFVQTSRISFHENHATHKPKRRRKQTKNLIGSDDSESNLDSNSEIEHSVHIRNLEIVHQEPSCLLESLPAEVLQTIASYAQFDADLCRLIQASPNMAIALNPNESGVWRNRFLAKYDYPFIINGREEFAVAYKLRQFVLRNFISFGGTEDERTAIQLAVIRDIVLETYNRPNEFVPFPLQSRNLELLSKCPLATTFLASPFSAHETAKYGKENVFFDALQLQLSHLVLSPRYTLGQRFTTSREHYDLSRVYNFNRPFSLLYTKVPVPKSSLSFSPRGGLGENQMSSTEYAFDTHTLLHIRNFWQRHLAHDSKLMGNSTYAPMAKRLLKLGMSPQSWEKPLQQPISLSNRWVGHYSCLYPWPKNYVDLEERQSCAEEWDRVDPMILDWVTCEDNSTHCFWPPAFNSIPAFRDTMPSITEGGRNGLIFIRGSSNFIDLTIDPTVSPEVSRQDDKIAEYHPFKASRLRGFIHEIADPKILNAGQRGPKEKSKRSMSSINSEEQPANETSIPGWKRIVMIIYKPTTRYLIQVLEHAEEDYGGVFGTEVTSNFNTATIWNNDGMDLDADEGLPHDNVETTSNQPLADGAINTSSNLPITVQQLEEQLQTILTRRIASFTRKYNKISSVSSRGSMHPPLFSPEHIISLEDSFIPSSYMAWDDGMSIEVAYAYEGVLLPGGKITLGRFYRCHGIDGLGDGREVGADGIGIEVRPVPSNNNENCSHSKRSGNESHEDQFEIFTNVDGTGEVIAARTAGVNGGCKGLDRGPFVFWAC